MRGCGRSSHLAMLGKMGELGAGVVGCVLPFILAVAGTTVAKIRAQVMFWYNAIGEQRVAFNFIVFEIACSNGLLIVMFTDVLAILEVRGRP